MQPKVMLTLLTVDMYTINVTKHSSPVWAVTMEWTDKENRIAVIALHKCSSYFWVTKIIKYCSCFVYCMVKLFLYTGGVSDRKRSGQPRVVFMPQINKAVSSRINWNPIWKQKKSWLGKCILHQELWVTLSNKTWGFQTTNRIKPYCCIKRK